MSSFHLKLNISSNKGGIRVSWKSTTLSADDVIFLVTETVKLESFLTTPLICPTKSIELTLNIIVFVVLVVAAMVQ